MRAEPSIGNIIIDFCAVTSVATNKAIKVTEKKKRGKLKLKATRV
jgi:hypothetical protein